jgi:MFS transporter, PAT family, beta-lactamase induction signal transducer AmpG
VLIVTLLGFSAGLPLALTTSTLMLWMTDVGVDLTTVGLYALAGLPYTLKFLWAPLVDAWRIPVLSRLLGRRRGWLIFTQLSLMAAILLLGRLDPLASPLLIAAAAVFVATVSATQDIVIDAFRVESLSTDQQAAGVGGYVMAYRLALLVSSAGVVGIVGFLEATGMPTTPCGSTAMPPRRR